MLNPSVPTPFLPPQITVALLKELPRADRPQQLSNVLLGFALLRWCPPVKDFWPAVWVAMQRLVLEEQRTPDVQVGRVVGCGGRTCCHGPGWREGW